MDHFLDWPFFVVKSGNYSLERFAPGVWLKPASLAIKSVFGEAAALWTNLAFYFQDIVSTFWAKPRTFPPAANAKFGKN
jgi:hypothetical protein